MSKKAAQEVASLLRKKPDAVIGLATGSTPIGMYKELVRMHREEGLDFSKATFFNLDEYMGIPKDHPQSYHHFMREHLFAHVNADPARIHIPNGMTTDIAQECASYDQKIRDAGGIDLQVLGIGANGHIGFNEPGTAFGLGTHMVELSEQTRRDNARFFEGDISKVPTHAITMGPDTIMKAKRVLLLASGEAKEVTVDNAFNGKVTEALPASILQNHPDTTFYLDAKATKPFKKWFPTFGQSNAL